VIETASRYPLLGARRDPWRDVAVRTAHVADPGEAVGVGVDEPVTHCPLQFLLGRRRDDGVGDVLGDPVEAVERLQLLAAAGLLPVLAVPFERVVDRADQQVARDVVLDEVVLCAALDRLDADLAVVEAGEDDHREHPRLVDDGGERVEAGAVRQVQVQ